MCVRLLKTVCRLLLIPVSPFSSLRFFTSFSLFTHNCSLLCFLLLFPKSCLMLIVSSVTVYYIVTLSRIYRANVTACSLTDSWFLLLCLICFCFMYSAGHFIVMDNLMMTHLKNECPWLSYLFADINTNTSTSFMSWYIS